MVFSTLTATTINRKEMKGTKRKEKITPKSHTHLVVEEKASNHVKMVWQFTL